MFQCLVSASFANTLQNAPGKATKLVPYGTWASSANLTDGVLLEVFGSAQGHEKFNRTKDAFLDDLSTSLLTVPKLVGHAWRPWHRS